MKKVKVAILYGGRSVEHGVSINSARNIFQFIDRKKFDPIAIGLTTEGRWYLTKGVDRAISRGEALQISLQPGQAALTTKSGKKIKPDIIFPVLHGTDGEDGSIQGLLKAMDLPMIGSSVLGSAVAMNKIVAKQLLEQTGIPVVPFIALSYGDPIPSYSEITGKLGSPIMVKAASLGSSVGVSKARDEKEYKKAIAEAFRYDNELLFEKFVPGREIECAVMGNPPKASRPGEIIVGKGYDFYTFDAKYVDGDAVRIDVPAKLDNSIAEEIRELSVRAYRALRCEDYARVDLFLTANGEMFINEINTIPGFTNASMFPMMWKEQGISFSNLITKLIQTALKRTKAAARIRHDFKSSLNY